MQTPVLAAVLLASAEFAAAAQDARILEQRGPQPLYQVTIVARTTKAINYGYLSAPTRIGFKGTPVAASAKGKGRIEPGRGSTRLDLRFSDLPAPGTFGPQYLTYVVWAISPEGRAQNLGELVREGGDKARLAASTPLQTFALIVTAEPYYSVSQPSDVVVVENVVTRDTMGKVEEVNARYELLPRQPYTYHAGAPQAASGQAVSPAQYESTVALYQALNAIQIAQAQNADRFAPEQMARAREIYNKARTMPSHLNRDIISMAREATQIAEDSRAIAAKHASREDMSGQARTEEQRQSQGERQP